MRSFLPTFFLAGLAAATASPDQNLITIGDVTFSGNGCPQGSVSTSISPDKTVITFGFDGFQTYIGPGTSVMDRTKNCQMHLELKYPKGYSFAVIQSTYHGFAMLDPGVRASFLSTYFFSNNAAKTFTTRTTIEGGGIWAEGDVYTKQDTVPSADVVKSPCGTTGILNINNRISLASSGGSSAFGMVSDDDATVDLSQQVNIEWFEC